MADPVTSVIVPARDAQQTLFRTLRALQAQELEDTFEVIVVDDGSTDRTAAIASEAGSDVSLVKQPPLGPAAARNRGVRQARGELLAFCDADVVPVPGWLRAGTRALRDAELVQGRVLPDPGAPLGPFDLTIWVTHAAGLWETANLFVRRELFARLDGFEQWLRPRSGKALAEDVWFGYRALRVGASTSFCAEALAHHAVFARDWRQYISEHRRLQYFPAMVGRMEELRRAFLYRRAFLNRRSARFDLALAAIALSRTLRSPWPLAAVLPYARTLQAEALRARPLDPPAGAVAAADMAADFVGLLAMAYGSVRYRTLVL
jgi:glycosyltransferase involved in cell wall biosynthesis